MKRLRLLSAFFYRLVISVYFTVNCTGLPQLTLITSQFQKQFQETVFDRSLVIFTSEITQMLTMIIIEKSGPYLRFWIRISKDLCLQITSVSKKVDTVPSILLEESPYDLGLSFGVYAGQMGTFFVRKGTVEKILIYEKQD